ncbi:MAG TPA: hypothetical protein VFH89_15445 [Sphingomicrobium sp.]|nr:hypothetical protein [Sphingomicrobium sp.]
MLLFLGWFYATADNLRSGVMFKKSLLLFALPIILSPAALFQFPLGMWVLVAWEEVLKAFASTRERNPIDKFWLVALFGLWELTIDKPFWGFVLARSEQGWDRLALVGFLCATALPVLMHAVTAAIYAFTFERRLWAAFIASWVIHATFNEAASYFGLSLAAAITETAILVAILMAIFSRQRRLTTVTGC